MRVEGMSFCQKKDLLKLRLFCLSKLLALKSFWGEPAGFWGG